MTPSISMDLTRAELFMNHADTELVPLIIKTLTSAKRYTFKPEREERREEIKER